MTVILALDIAAHTGWAVGDGTLSGTKYGTEDFSRYLTDHAELGQAFNWWLCDMLTSYAPDLLAWEAGFFRGASSAHLTGMRWEANRVGHARGVPRTQTYPVTIKKFITGSGKAKKHEVIQAVKNRGFVPKDDNAADAIALLLYKLESKQ